MHIDALFFAAYRELVGRERLRIPIPEEGTVEALVRELRGRGQPWSRLPARPAVALNRRYVDGSARLRTGDEVAFIPPVAGG
jgi:molybdopterin converting factor subunit 1